MSSEKTCNKKLAVILNTRKKNPLVVTVLEQILETLFKTRPAVLSVFISHVIKLKIVTIQ